MNISQQHTVFLDRDGVINEDSPAYIKSWEEFRFISGSLAAIAEMTRRGYRIGVVSNQSGIGRGLFPVENLEEMHEKLAAAAEAAGGRIDGFFYCPHRPDEDCSCRKPRDGLIRRACRRFGIDPSTAAMVGDSAKDIIAGRRAGCALAVLVRTGNWTAAERELAASGVRPDHVADDLKAAARWLMERWK